MNFPGNTDELLVAYLDDELNAAQRQNLEERLSTDGSLAKRLELLKRSNLPFKSAFAPLLKAAPQVSLLADFPRPTLTRRNLIAAAVGFLALGVLGDRTMLFLTTPEDNWRELVAQYMALYSSETLAESLAPEALEAQLQVTGQKLGITLSSEKLALTGALLKNARVLAYDKQRIAQITWLDKQNQPLALCITENTGAGVRKGVQAQNEKRLGMNIVYWASDAHQFMVIGHGSSAQMNEIAGRLQREIGG